MRFQIHTTKYFSCHTVKMSYCVMIKHSRSNTLAYYYNIFSNTIKRVDEKRLNITSHHGNENQSCYEITFHTHRNGYNQKVRFEQLLVRIKKNLNPDTLLLVMKTGANVLECGENAHCYTVSVFLFYGFPLCSLFSTLILPD